MVESKNEIHAPFRARPFCRIVAVTVSVPAICIGVLALVSNGAETPSSNKFDISSLVLGILFLLLGIRGRLFR
jgi:hypothetical protein